MSCLTVRTPIGLLCIHEEGGMIVECAAASLCENESSSVPLLIEAKRQLEAYFRGELLVFDLPLEARGTEFERSVWAILRMIPYGQTMTYGQIAQRLGSPGAARAVGRACARNPLLIFVPCHRVIGSGARLTGFAAGLEAKRALLALEANQIK